MIHGYRAGHSKTNGGFTIVELLIVIIVIGILATLILVAYGNLTTQAKTTVITGDLVQAAKQLNIDQIQSGSGTAFPVSTSAANNGNGLSASNGTTYDYYVNNTVSPAMFCLNATNGNLKYYVTSSTTSSGYTTKTAPTVGSCPVTNLSSNPSMETDASYLFGFTNTGGSVTNAVMSGGAVSGSKYYRMTITGGGTGTGGGIYEYNMLATGGTKYTASAYLRNNATRNMYMGLEWHGTATTTTVSPVSAVGTSWTRLSVSGTAPAGTTSVTLVMYIDSATTTFGPGDYEDADAIMLTQGSTLYNYGDGNSSGWAWSGTANLSPSTGPAL